MWKLKSLRTLLEKAVPELAADVSSWTVRATEGRVLATLAGGLSFEYVYTAEISVSAYAGDTDALLVPLLAWARTHQYDLLENPELARKGIEFKLTPADAAVGDVRDVLVTMPLTERVIVTLEEGTPASYRAEHPREPCHPGRPCVPEHWELWLKDRLLAQWDIEAPQELQRLGWA